MAAEAGRATAADRLRAALVWLPAGLAIAAGWAYAATRLWDSSTVPDDLKLPHLDQHAYFSPGFLERSASYERFLRIDFVLATLVLLIVLALYARYGERFTRESAAGRVGTGMLLGMLGFAFVWLSQLPFGIAGLWWERRHHISKQGYLEVVTGSFLGLGRQFIFVCIAIGIVMAFAGVLRQRWWMAAVPVFAALVLLSAFLQPYLTTGLEPLHNKHVAADARAIARKDGVPRVEVKVEKVHKQTTAPNAESIGIGPSRRVILWDTLLDGRFSRGEIRTIVAHEFGHVKRDHVLKGVAWVALALIPITALIAFATRRRGGLYRPEAVPLALFVLIAAQIAILPLQNAVSRHVEQEADWIALQTTRDPRAAQAAFTELGRASLTQPRPPKWSYLLFDTHPTIMQRIEMTKAWSQRHGGG